MTSFITEGNRVGELDKKNKKNRKSPSNTQWKQKRKKKKNAYNRDRQKIRLDLLFPTYLGETS